MELITESEKERFARHLILEEIGEKGQIKLKSSKVLVVGTGGLGSPVLYYLTAAGIGQIGLVDNDTVDVSNLQRQILHNTNDLGRAKTESAGDKLHQLNPGVNLIKIQKRLTEDNVISTISGYDVVIDATDNYTTRFLLNKACVVARIPFIHGGVRGFYGQILTVMPAQGPCLQCVFPELAEASSPPGVVGAVVGTIGAIQATEALKIVLGLGKLLVGRLLIYDALKVSMREVPVKRDLNCIVCGRQ